MDREDISHDVRWLCSDDYGQSRIMLTKARCRRGLKTVKDLSARKARADPSYLSDLTANGNPKIPPEQEAFGTLKYLSSF